MTLLAPSTDVEVDDASITIIRQPRAPRTRRGRARRWAEVHRLGVAISGAGAVVALSVFWFWFRTGAFYARGDVAPFVRANLREEFGGLWTHQTSGSGGPTYEVVRLVELVFADIAHLVGGGDALGQRLLFAAIFAFAATGVAALTARFVERASLVGVAGVVGAFAPVTMVNLPNFLMPVCIGLVSWAAAFAVDVARELPPRPRTLALVALSASYLALNPALLAIAFVWIAALPVTAMLVTGTGRAGLRRVARFLGLAAAWAVPISLWWIVPYGFAMRSAANTGTINANTNVASWSWTHAHGSLDRVFMLVAKWSWPDPKLGVNASKLAGGGWLWLAAALPIALLASPLLARRRQRPAALWFVLGALILAFVGKGLNAPLRGVNEFLYRLPGTWLLREPMAKVGALMVPVVLAGWALGVDGLATWRRTRRVRAALVFLLCAPIAFAIPMLTGSVIRADERVRVPDAWNRVARVVNDGRLAGKAMILPLDDFYQVPTTWGYYGTDTVVSQLLERPSITRNPQSYIGEPGDFGNLAESVETGIVGGDPGAVPGALRALDVSYLVVRRDIDQSSPIRKVDMPDADALTAGLASVPGLRRVATTSVADVYENTGVSQTVQALSRTITARDVRGAALASLVAGAPAGTALTTSDPELPLSQGEARFVDVNATRTVAVPTKGVWQYQRRANGPALLEVRATAAGVVMHEPVSMQVGSTAIAARADETVAGTGRAVAVDIDGAITDLTRGASYARVAPGAAVTSLALDPAQRLGEWSELGDCNKYSSLDARQAGLAASRIATPGGNGVRLRASRHSACVSAAVGGAAMNQVVRVSLDARSLKGAAPRVCLWQAGLQQCAPLNWTAARSGDWIQMRALYRLPVAGSVRLFVYADQPAKGTPYTETQYRALTVQRLIPGATRAVRPPALPSGSITLDSTTTPLAVSFGGTSPVVGRATRAGDCARADERDLSELGIFSAQFSNDPTGVRVSARRHSGCVSMPVTGLRPAMKYELDIDHRVWKGAPPRVCVWQETTERCARFTAVGGAAGTAGRLRYRGEIDPTASAVRLYLYADATKKATTIDYRKVRFRPVTDESLVLWPTGKMTAVAPKITSTREGSTYHVRVRGANGPFLLALSDAYSSSFQLRGVPGGVPAEHLMIDGYRNGWAIDARGDFDLTISYGPARFAKLARVVSFVTLLAMLGLVPFAPLVVRNRRRLAARRARARQPGPRRIALPESWPDAPV